MDVSVRELKNRLSEYLRRVQAGERIRVTSRGRVIAQLSGAANEAGESDEALAQRFQSQPWVVPAESSDKPLGAHRRAKRGNDTPSSDDILDEIRG